MKKIVMPLLVTTVLAFLEAFGAFAAFESTEENKTPNIGIPSPLAQAQATKGVVLVNCNLVATVPMSGVPLPLLPFSIETRGSSSSADTPSVPAGGCAQTLADLRAVGFRITQQSGGTNFTLEK